MLRSWLGHSDIIAREPSLEDYLRTDQIDFDTLISEAKQQLTIDVKNRNIELKKLCVTLSLTNATKSDCDYGERTRLVINASAVTDQITGVLEGTNDTSSESYTTVLNNIQFAEIGEHTYTFEDVYDYYKLTLTGTVTFTAYLVERSFELPHLYLSLSLIYRQLESLNGDIYGNKAQAYFDLYRESLHNAVYSYDYDESGTLDADEMEITRVRFSR